MATATIQPPDDVIRLATARAAAAGHRSVDEYIRALVLADAEAGISPEVEAHLLAAVDTPSREMTAADWDEKRRTLSAKLQQESR
ncbi:MAG TPA: hypothetical protein VGI81_18345 [Tepidisphaeraceae bacterium]|jgi:hypothetical protein